MITKKKLGAMSDRSLRVLEEMAGMKLTFGNFLWSIRESEKTNQTDFAKRLELSPQYLCDLERGRRTVSPRVAAELAEKLGYSTQQFVRLALQDEVNKAGLHYDVQLQQAKAA